MTPSNGDMVTAIDIVERHIKRSDRDQRAYSDMDGNQRALVDEIAKALKFERVWARRAGRATPPKLETFKIEDSDIAAIMDAYRAEHG